MQWLVVFEGRDPANHKVTDQAIAMDSHQNKFRTLQKQPSRGVLKKRCSENMQQIYRRTPMPKCDFNKLLCNFIETALWHGCSPVNLLHIFTAPFPKSTSGWLLLKLDIFFSGKQQGSIRTDLKISYPLLYHFCMVVTIFKVATSLLIVPTTGPSLAQQRKQEKSNCTSS